MTNCILCSSTRCQEIESFTKRQLLKSVPKIYYKQIATDIQGVTNFSVQECIDCQLIFYTPITPGSDLLYQQLAADPLYYMETKPEYELIRRYIPESGVKILEVGCGSGFFAKSLGCDLNAYHGLEFNPAAVEKAKTFGLSVSNETIESYSKGHQAEFDVVGSFQVLEHVANPGIFIQSSLDCLQTGGLFFLAVPNQDSYLEGMRDAYANLPPHHVSRWRESTVESVASRFGLQLIAIIKEELADYHLQSYVISGYRNSSNKSQTRRFVSESTRRASVASRIYEKIFVDPILRKVSMGLKNAPRPIGHTIIGVYRKK